MTFQEITHRIIGRKQIVWKHGGIYIGVQNMKYYLVNNQIHCNPSFSFIGLSTNYNIKTGLMSNFFGFLKFMLYCIEKTNHFVVDRVCKQQIFPEQIFHYRLKKICFLIALGRIVSLFFATYPSTIYKIFTSS